MFRYGKLSLVFTIILLFSLSSLFAQNNHGLFSAPDRYKIVTGGGEGTYFAFGRALSEVAKKQKIHLEVNTSSGSLSNILTLCLGQSDFALCQYDVLQGVLNRPEGRELRNHVSLIMPLYYEEVHLIVHKKSHIHTLKDLKGKMVGMGEVNSGTFYTARSLLHLAEIPFDEIRPNYSSPGEALKKLMAGELDAVFYTAGKPVSFLQNLDTKSSSALSLFSFSSQLIKKISGRGSFYRAVTIEGKTYPFESKKITTLATPCVLIARQNLSPEMVQTLCKDIFLQQRELKKFHPKWRELGLPWSREFLSKMKISLHPGSRHFHFGSVVTKGSLTLCTGASGGTYEKVARDFKKCAEIYGLNLSIMPSGGAGQNIVAVSLGQSDLGMVQLDSLLYMAFHYPSLISKLQLVIPLYYEEVHLLIRKNLPIGSIEDLKGKRVNIGLPGSGTSITTTLILSSYGLDPQRDFQSDQSSPTEALSKLAKGELDAVFVIGGSPISSLTRLSASYSEKISLFPLDKKVIERIEKSQPALNLNVPYTVVILKEGLYPWLKKDTRTLATPCLLITRNDIPSQKIYTLVEAVLFNNFLINHPKLRGYDLKRVLKITNSGVITLGLHKGAEEYLYGKKSQGKSDNRTSTNKMK